MGWAGGSELFEAIIRAAGPRMGRVARKNFYKIVLKAFEDNDWDTQEECRGLDPVFDSLLPELEEDEE